MIPLLELDSDGFFRLERRKRELLTVVIRLLALPMDLSRMAPLEALELGYIHSTLEEIVADVTGAPKGALPRIDSLVDVALRGAP